MSMQTETESRVDAALCFCNFLNNGKECMLWEEQVLAEVLVDILPVIIRQAVVPAAITALAVVGHQEVPVTVLEVVRTEAVITVVIETIMVDMVRHRLVVTADTVVFIVGGAIHL